MKNQLGRAILMLAALMVVSGCSSLHQSVSPNAWSQTAAKEERQQQLNTAPPGEWFSSMPGRQ